MSETLAEKIKKAARKLSVTAVNPKAFIIDVFDALVESGDVAEGELDNFKFWLVSMHRRRFLTICHCDLAPAFDPEKVRQSKTRYHGAEYYFIRG